MVSRTEYVVDTDGLSRSTEIAACRLALRLVADEAHTFATDIPWSQQADWSAEVRAAARRLTTRSKGRRGEKDVYRHTGVVSAKDVDDWSAFVAFAPFAFDAAVWAEDKAELASLADEGAPVVIRLLAPERQRLEQLVGRHRVVAMRDWTNARRRRRMAPGGDNS